MAAPAKSDIISPARRLLATTSLSSYLSRRPGTTPILLAAETTVSEALTRMETAGILSAPCLYASSYDDASAVHMLGWVHVADVVLSILRELYPQLLSAELSSAASMEDFLSSSRPGVSETREVLDPCFRTLFLTRQIRTLRPGDASGDGDGMAVGFLSLESARDTSLLDVIRSGVLPAHAALSVGTSLRAPTDVAVVAVNVRVTNIVAQSDILGFLLESGPLGPLSSTTVGVLAALPHLFSLSSPLLLPFTLPTICCFACIHNAKQSFAGITDEQGRLVSCLSISDVRRLHTEAALGDLAIPVGEFLAHGGRLPQLVSCPPSATVEEVMQLLLANEVHQIFVVDAQTVVGAISISDLLQLAARDDQ